MNLVRTLLPQSFRNRHRLEWTNLNLEMKILWDRIRRVFLKPPFPILENGGINLHLGCGSVAHPKFVNIDLLPAPHVHYVRSIDDLSPFKDSTVSLIHASHCLEHFPHGKVSDVLKEWCRVLKKGGILRLSVPNFDVLLDIYNENGKDIDLIMSMLMGYQNYKYNYHKIVFTNASLSSLLRDVGFKEIREWQPGSCELTSFDDWSARKVTICGKDYSISLNIEAVK
jgi:predicted SAM-dependent methyltransferase